MVGVWLDRLYVNLHREAPAGCEDLAARTNEGSHAPWGILTRPGGYCARADFHCDPQMEPGFLYD